MLSKSSEAIARACAREADDIGEFAVDMGDWGEPASASTGALLEDLDFGYGKEHPPSHAQADAVCEEELAAEREVDALAQHAQKSAQQAKQRTVFDPPTDITGLATRRAGCENDPWGHGGIELISHEFAPGDLGNAQRFFLVHGHNFRSLSDTDKWIKYTGGYWAHCYNREHDTAMISVAQEMDAYEMPLYADSSDKLSKKMHAVRDRLCDDGGQKAALRVAEKLPALKLPAAALDRNPWLFNFKNGTFDTKSMSFREHEKKDYISRQSPINYNPDAPKPVRWLKFLDECMQGDAEMIARLQKLWGLSLCRALMHKEQYLFVHTGKGSNGKSTAFSVISKIFGAMQTSAAAFGEDGGELDTEKAYPPEAGNYIGLISPNTFIASKKADDGSGPAPQLLDLRGTHMNLVSELPQGSGWNEALVKAITGKDAVVGRGLHEKRNQTFLVDGFLHFLTNHVPKIDSSNFSMLRRLQMIPWPANFTGDQIDTSLPEKLMAEAEGIVLWLVEGLAAYKKDVDEGRDLRHQPQAGRAALDEFMESIDIITQFKHACVVPARDIDEVSARDAFDLFLEWAEASNIQYNRPTLRTFNDRLLASGVQKRETRSKNGTVFVGIKLNRDYE